MKRLAFVVMILVFCIVGCGASKNTSIKSLNDSWGFRFKGEYSDFEKGDLLIPYIKSAKYINPGGSYNSYYLYTAKLTKFSLNELEKRLDSLEWEESILGEYWDKDNRTCNYDSCEEKPKWQKFNKKNIDDKVDGFTKIDGDWVPNTCIIYYEDQYKDRRDKIEKIAEKEYKKVR